MQDVMYKHLTCWLLGNLQDGYYNLYTGAPYSDLQNSLSYSGCGQLLSASTGNNSLSFVDYDDKTGLQQFQLQLVKSPDQYTISIPRCVQLCLCKTHGEARWRDEKCASNEVKLRDLVYPKT